MSDSLEQTGTEVELWNNAVTGKGTATFSIHEKNGVYTAIGLKGANHISMPFDHYPSRQEVEERFISDFRFTHNCNIMH